MSCCKKLFGAGALVLALMMGGGAGMGHCASEPGAIPGGLNVSREGSNGTIRGTGVGLSQYYSFTGKIFVSVDGSGSNSASHAVQVEKPNSAAVVIKAYLLAASYPDWSVSPDPITRIIKDGDVALNGVAVKWNGSYLNPFLGTEWDLAFHNVRADVTSIVKPVVDAAAVGKIDFTLTEVNAGTIDGEILVVVFKDPAQTQLRTISLLFGGQKTQGDSFFISLAKPFDPGIEGAVANMGLGISYSYQGYGNQYSTIDVNGKRLSSAAGGCDDGASENGALITVGGLNDSNTNPPDPNYIPYESFYDDELYSMLPFVTKGDTEINVATVNPSNDDNIFFAYFLISGEAEVNKDTDGDGLLDDWEKNGYDADGDGVVDVDLPAMGANPLHKDIFVEVDWMASGTHTHKPIAGAVGNVVAAFKNAPVANPDRVNGINIHIDAGTLGGGNAVAHDDNLDPVWTEFDAIKDANFNPDRVRIFHYCLFAHNYSGTSSSGLSRGIPASDFIVSLGSWPNGVGTRKQQAGTLMHELGHNLGLRHGGNDHTNYKPNFLSIMSYSFQMDWLRYKGKNQKLDYSRFNIKSLDENHLNELRGLDGVGGDTSLLYYGTMFYDPSETVRIANNARVKVDWNFNGDPTETDVAVDVNDDGVLGTLTGNCIEWKNIVFNGGNIGAGLVLPARVDVVFPELTFEEYQRMMRSAVEKD